MSAASPRSGAIARSAARLAALQALYQLEMTEAAPEEVIREFIEFRFGQQEAQDDAFFAALVHGVVKHQVEIDRAIAASLSEGWTLARIDSILRALLRAAAYELIGRADVPAKVVIDEYVELARDFFDGDEPKFVNAVLDKLAREKRAAEFGPHPSTGSG
jgi:N utilization substance protein B